MDKESATKREIARFMQLGSKIPCLYNVDALKSAESVLICEGESDTLTAITHGYAAVGVPGAQNFRATWVELFRDKEIFLVLDADRAGDASVPTIRKLFRDAWLPIPRCVHLPLGQDLNEFFRAGKMGQKAR